jgi:hypothetical protein
VTILGILVLYRHHQLPTLLQHQLIAVIAIAMAFGLSSSRHSHSIRHRSGAVSVV